MIHNASPTTFESVHESALTGSAVMAFARAVLSVIVASALLMSAAAGLYLVKSALGINLLPWHSPLHDLLYRFVL